MMDCKTLMKSSPFCRIGLTSRFFKFFAAAFMQFFVCSISCSSLSRNAARSSSKSGMVPKKCAQVSSSIASANSHRHNPKKWRKQECIVIFFDKTSSSRPSLPEKIPCRKRWETGLLMTKNKAVPNKQLRWPGHLSCLMVRKRWDDRVKTVRWSGRNSLFSTIKKWLKIKVTDIQEVRKQPENREKSGKWPSVFNFRLLRARFLSVY